MRFPLVSRASNDALREYVETLHKDIEGYVTQIGELSHKLLTWNAGAREIAIRDETVVALQRKANFLEHLVRSYEQSVSHILSAPLRAETNRLNEAIRNQAAQDLPEPGELHDDDPEMNDR